MALKVNLPSDGDVMKSPVAKTQTMLGLVFPSYEGALTKVVKSGLHTSSPELMANDIASAGSLLQSIAQPFAEVKALTKMKVLGSELDANISELLHLDRVIADLNIGEITKRRDELRKLVAAEFPKDSDQHLPGEPVIFTTPEGTVTLTPFSSEFKITDMPGLYDKLGLDTFIALAKLSITDLKKVLSENELGTYGTTQYGSRSLKVSLAKVEA